MLMFDVTCHLHMPHLEIATFQIFFANRDLILPVPWLTSQVLPGFYTSLFGQMTTERFQFAFPTHVSLLLVNWIGMAVIACATLDACVIPVQLLRRFSPSMYPQMDSTMNDLVPTWNLISSSQQAHAITTLLLKFVLYYVNELKHKYFTYVSM